MIVLISIFIATLNKNISNSSLIIFSFLSSSLFVILSLFLINLGYFRLIGYKRVYKEFLSVEGYIVDNMVSTEIGNDNIVYYAIFEYSVKNNIYRNLDDIPNNKRYLINKKVKIIYKDNSPTESILLYDYLKTGIIFLIIGSIFFTILIYFILFN